MPISPDMLSPETAPVKESVSGIGLVMETFQATLSPLTVPSKISVELPSAPCVPVSVPPAALIDSDALRSPIGVLITRFQFPSTAISVSPTVQLKRRYSQLHCASPTVFSVFLTRFRAARYTVYQARAAARRRLPTRSRKVTYWIANAASFAPTSTTVT